MKTAIKQGAGDPVSAQQSTDLAERVAVLTAAVAEMTELHRQAVTDHAMASPAPRHAHGRERLRRIADRRRRALAWLRRELYRYEAQQQRRDQLAELDNSPYFALGYIGSCLVEATQDGTPSAALVDALDMYRAWLDNNQAVTR